MKSGWENVTCPICENGRFLEVYYDEVTTWEYPGTFRYLECTNCGLVLQSPRINIDKIGRYYSPQTYWGFNLKNESRLDWKKERIHNYDPLYKKIFSLKTKGKILDIGCGLGVFLSEFKERGWETVGTETSKEVAKFAVSTFGIDVKIGDLLKLNLPKNYFDVISFSGVFEHIYNPSETLKKVRSLLKKDGILIIVTPNLESIGHLIFNKRWVSFEPGRHVFLFTPKTIKKLLKKTDFKIVDVSHNYWRHNIYGLFTSFRYTLSPRFKDRQDGGVYRSQRKKNISIIKEIGKLIGVIFSYIGAALEVILGRSESMIVYAKKKKT